MDHIIQNILNTIIDYWQLSITTHTAALFFDILAIQMNINFVLIPLSRYFYTGPTTLFYA
jgi:hypothetical protein